MEEAADSDAENGLLNKTRIVVRFRFWNLAWVLLLGINRVVHLVYSYLDCHIDRGITLRLTTYKEATLAWECVDGGCEQLLRSRLRRPNNIPNIPYF